MSRLPRLLRSRSPEVQAAVLSLLWVLVHDSEKVKAALRRTGVSQLVAELVSHLEGAAPEEGAPEAPEAPVARYARGLVMAL